MKKKINILIFGGTGFIGYHLAKKCLKLGWDVTSFSTKKPKKIRYLSQVKYTKCDISKRSVLSKKINKRYDYVVNLAGYVDHSNKSKTYNSHFVGVKNISNYFLKKKIIAFVQIGSGGEYGNTKSPHNEKMKGKGLSVYNKSKLLSTSHLIKLNNTNKFPSIVLRLYQAYGPKQDINRLIPIIIMNCLRNKSFDCSDGNQLRDFIYINDLVDLIIKCLKNNKKTVGEIINVGSGQPIKVKNIINSINKKIDMGTPIFGKIRLRLDEYKNTFPKINKALKLTNWRPKVPFKIGLKKTINYYIKNVSKFK